MKTKIIEKQYNAWFALKILLFVLAATYSASAQYTLDNTYSDWTGYNSYFLFSDNNATHPGKFFAQHRGSTTPTISGFWEEAEEIELAVDAYYWSVNNYPTHDHSAYVNEINSLCTGFENHNGNDWSANAFNDDLDWAIIAFTRAYQVTGTAAQLADAETNFTTVWTRAQAGNGGLLQSQPHGTGWTPNLDSPVNFGFVIAGYLLYNNTSTTSYKTHADTVYNWAMANLYTTTVDGGVCTGHASLTCSKIYDSNNTGPFPNYPTYAGTGIGASDFTYNYGIAIQATTREGDSAKAQNIANWLMYNSNNPNYPYVGTYNGYEILPNYGQNGVNDAGYNGIALRGVGFGYSRGALNATTLAWAQANVSAAWNNRNSDNVIWNDWKPGDTTTGTEYSWDCSAALAGMLDIPPP
jgi:hypothetical protein